MKIKVLFRTSIYRGDHDADVNILYELLPDETVEALVARVGMNLPHDTIELKLIKE